jgi:hypothetical protein
VTRNVFFFAKQLTTKIVQRSPKVETYFESVPTYVCGIDDFVKSGNVVHPPLGKTGVDVMITIFFDFCQFSEKKMAFF